MSKKPEESKGLHVNQYVFALVALAAGLVIGYFANNIMQAKLPTAQQIEQTKNDIAKLYKGKTVDACWQVNNGPNLGVGKYELNYRYLRINRQLNRAIITDCGESDTLLYKNKANEWVKTDINVTLNNRVNPVWQKACEIQDITVADDQVRPENSSIDEMNLQECKQISQQ